MYKMQRLEVSGALRLIFRSLGVKGLKDVSVKSKCDVGVHLASGVAVSPWRARWEEEAMQIL